jgi:rhamnosyltransferase
VVNAGPSVSVVIRSFQEERFIRRLFLGLQGQTLRDFEVILVDSGSTDRTVEIARSFGAKIRHIDKAEFSFGRSLNIGCAEARGDILVFASAHVYPTRTDWLERLIAPFENPKVMVAYGKQRGDERTKFAESRIFKQWFPDQSDWNQTSPFCNNANCAVRRSMWEALRFDEALTGLEDLAFAKEVIRRGGRVAYDATAEIVHVHEETWDRIRNRYRREAIALRQIEPTMSFGLFDFLNLTVRNIVSDLAEARRQRRLLQEWSDILLFRYNQFYGTYLGYASPPQVSLEIRNRFYFPPGAGQTDAVHHHRGQLAAPSQLHIDYESMEGRVASSRHDFADRIAQP